MCIRRYLTGVDAEMRRRNCSDEQNRQRLNGLYGDYAELAKKEPWSRVKNAKTNR